MTDFALGTSARWRMRVKTRMPWFPYTPWVSEPADMVFTIYDVERRRVCELQRGRRPAGDGRIAWDGVDAGGRRPAPGVYFARLEIGRRSLARAFVRVR